MQLDKFQAVAKKRSGWEALDLGCMLARGWFLTLWLTWLIPAGICLTLLSLIFHDQPSIAGGITWLLKPVWERPLLFIASRRIFSEQISQPEIMRHYLNCNKRDWLWWISLRRLSPLRSFSMPVTVLEGLKGKARSDRVNLLQRRCSSPATWLLISGVHIELFISLALAAGFFLLLPQGIEIEWNRFLFLQPTLSNHVYNILWLISASVVAPFYVCAGFTLYLQRRIDLEGWDIEIQLRQLALRLTQKRSGHLSRTPLVILFVLGTAGLFSSEMSLAQSEQNKKIQEAFSSINTAQADETSEHTTLEQVAPANTSQGASSPLSVDENPFATSTGNENPAKKEGRQRIHDILSEPPFYHEKIEKNLSFKPKDADEGLPDWLLELAEWLDAHGGFFSSLANAIKYIAKTTEVLLWALALLLIIFALWRYRKWIQQSLNHLKPKHAAPQNTPPKTLFGIDLNESVSDHQASDDPLHLWRQGEHRQAFALLLRKTLLNCINQGCIFKDGYTESECADVVSLHLDSARAQHFSSLIQAWQQLAYAHRACDDEQFNLLCQEHIALWNNE